MQKYNNILDTLESYRQDLTKALKENKLYFDTDEINLSVGNNKINYHRWLHPNQGDWELEWLFNDYKLSCIKKLIRDDSVVIDIGAHTGNYSVAYSLFANKVISFEPNPVTFNILEKNSKLNPNIIPYNIGCSITDKQASFNYSDPGFNNGGMDMGLMSGSHQHKIDVYCVNIDNFLKQFHLDDYNNIGFIKIDCEGHDKEILPTLKGIIQKNKPIIETEIFDGFTLEQKQELVDVIHSLGYDCYNFTSANDDIDLLGEKITIDSIKEMQTRNEGGHNLICFPKKGN